MHRWPGIWHTGGHQAAIDRSPVVRLIGDFFNVANKRTPKCRKTSLHISVINKKKPPEKGLGRGSGERDDTLVGTIIDFFQMSREFQRLRFTVFQNLHGEQPTGVLDEVLKYIAGVKFLQTNALGTDQNITNLKPTFFGG